MANKMSGIVRDADFEANDNPNKSQERHIHRMSRRPFRKQRNEEKAKKKHRRVLNCIIQAVVMTHTGWRRKMRKMRKEKRNRKYRESLYTKKALAK
jgi:hypothetical protein